MFCLLLVCLPRLYAHTLSPPLSLVQYHYVRLPLPKDTERQPGALKTDGATTIALQQTELHNTVTAVVEKGPEEADSTFNATLDEEAGATADVSSIYHNPPEATAENSLAKVNDERFSLATGGPLLETTVDEMKPAIDETLTAGAPPSSGMDVGALALSSEESQRVPGETSSASTEVETAEIDTAAVSALVEGAETQQGGEPPPTTVASAGLDEVPTTSVSDPPPDIVQGVPRSDIIGRNTKGDELIPNFTEESDISQGGDAFVALEHDATETAGANELASRVTQQSTTTIEEAAAEHVFEVSFTAKTYFY